MIKNFNNILTALTVRERKKFISLLLLDVFVNAADIVFVIILFWIVKFYTGDAEHNFTVQGADWIFNNQSPALIIFFLMLFSMKNILAYYSIKFQNDFLSSVTIRLSEENISNYLESNYEDTTSKNTSSVLHQTGFYPMEFCQYILSGFLQIITQAASILFVISTVLWLDAKLFLFLIILLLPPAIITFYLVKKRLTQIRKTVRESSSESYQHLLDAIGGYVEANTYHKSNFFRTRFMISRKLFSNSLFKAISMQVVPARIIEVFVLLGLLLIIVFTTSIANQEHTIFLSAGAFLVAAYKIIPGIIKIITNLNQIRTYEHTIPPAKNKEIIVGTDSLPVLNKSVKSIEFHKVSFSYTHRPVSSGISFSCTTKNFIGITGKSGTGKTTLFNLLLGFINPHEGVIVINGTPVSQDELKVYRNDISYSKQQIFLINDTIARNITLENKTVNGSRLEYAIEASGLHSIIEKLPAGINNMISENGRNLSGGQRQRIAFARTLYRDASVYLLDEPFSELDTSSARTLLLELKKIADSGKIVLLISHHTEHLEFCNKLISLD